jgi:hypothetical protein
LNGNGSSAAVTPTSRVTRARRSVLRGADNRRPVLAEAPSRIRSSIRYFAISPVSILATSFDSCTVRADPVPPKDGRHVSRVSFVSRTR